MTHKVRFNGGGYLPCRSGTSYDDLLLSSAPFPEPIALGIMVDFLVRKHRPLVVVNDLHCHKSQRKANYAVDAAAGG